MQQSEGITYSFKPILLEQLEDEYDRQTGWISSINISRKWKKQQHP